ncbi:hypothetical protein LTR17_023892 [Elasticomyces elasticus]|nr:hypothetical protein LTR17_023892 [Elasticomyces elasticus]
MGEPIEILIAESKAWSGMTFMTDTVPVKDIHAQGEAACSLCKLLSYGINIALANLTSLSTRGPLFLHRNYIPGTTSLGFQTLTQTLTPAFGFTLFTERGTHSPWPGLVSKRCLAPRIDFASCKDQIQTWIRTCDEEHTACSALVSPQLPSRVIDVGSVAEPRCVLVDSTGRIGAYVALSHCWGSPDTVPKTTKATLSQHKQCIPDSVLSNTFRHAVETTRGLGFAYVWIDALCIIQDDPEDWAFEAAKMRTVYSESAITLAAASAADGTGGCYHDRSSGEEFEYSDTSDPGQSIRVRLPVDHAFFDALSAGVQAHKSVERFPLATRKWVFQERMLSPRVLYFTKHELAWECRTEVACECGGADCLATPHETGYSLAMPKTSFPLASSSVPDISARAALLERWAILAEEYTSRSLTYPTDALVALSGVARAFDAAGLGAYHAGMWEHGLPLDLSWETVYQPDLHTAEPQIEYIAPSWSWVSSKTRVAYPRPKNLAERTRRLQYCCTDIISITSIPAKTDPFGRVLEYESSLEISAPALCLSVTGVGVDMPDIDIFGWPTQHFAADSNTCPTHLVADEVWVACLERRRPEGENVRGNRTGCSLVLEELDGGFFRRVGLIMPWITHDDGGFGEAVEAAPRKTFRVI